MSLPEIPDEAVAAAVLAAMPELRPDELDGEFHWMREAFAEGDTSRLRAELVQSAAVAVKWVEAIDGRAQ